MELKAHKCNIWVHLLAISAWHTSSGAIIIPCLYKWIDVAEYLHIIINLLNIVNKM